MKRRLSTAGMTLSWCKETTAGTRPTSGYTVVAEVKTVPSTNPEPNTIDVTPLNEEEFIQYISSLKDLGGVFAFTANLTEEGSLTEWNVDHITAYEGAVSSGLAMWYCISHPKLSKAVFFTGEPRTCGINESSVNAALETTYYVTPQSSPIWETKPTEA